ncbi:hypothetical protein CVT26_015441 [Gymnopilus dilepis]|uniref:Uncharacterized protein n=1 Tax=Gymnopilus dilepis TaxID=231916 RepID=A0A409YEL3_9AGAR|nr:hypothetical protein CVT26_015441 [Gymnopilus dilepis]
MQAKFKRGGATGGDVENGNDPEKPLKVMERNVSGQESVSWRQPGQREEGVAMVEGRAVLGGSAENAEIT